MKIFTLDNLRLMIGILIVVFIMAGNIGYTINFFKIFDCDFDKPYKCEITRVGGVVIPPVGAVAGYIDLGE